MATSTTARKPSTLSCSALIAAIRAHAARHYSAEWQAIVTRASDEELASMMNGVRTAEHAIAIVTADLTTHAYTLGSFEV